MSHTVCNFVSYLVVVVVEDVVLVEELRLELVGGAAGAGRRLLEHGHRLHDLLQVVLPVGGVVGDDAGQQLGVADVLDAEELGGNSIGFIDCQK